MIRWERAGDGCSAASPHSGGGMGRLQRSRRAGRESARVQRLSQDESQRGRRWGRRGGGVRSQPLTSVIRLSRVGKKIAGSVLVMAEDEKTRRLNKKTCVAHALRLIGCVPWITPERCCQLGKHARAHAHTHTQNKQDSFPA